MLILCLLMKSSENWCMRVVDFCIITSALEKAVGKASFW